MKQPTFPVLPVPCLLKREPNCSSSSFDRPVTHAQITSTKSASCSRWPPIPERGPSPGNSHALPAATHRFNAQIRRREKRRRKKNIENPLVHFLCFENFPVSSLLVCAGVTVLCAAAASKRRAPITGRFLWPDARCFLSTKVKISATFRLEFLSFLVLRIMDTFPERNSVVPEADKHCFFSFLVCLFYR